MTTWTQLGPCKLACGDCLEIMPDLQDNTIDAIITDPPYGYGLFKNDVPTDLTFLFHFVAKQTVCFLAIFGRLPFAAEWFRQAEQHELAFRDHIVWCKRMTAPAPRLSRTHESIFIWSNNRSEYLSKSGPYEDIRLPGLEFGAVSQAAINRYIKSLWHRIDHDGDEMMHKAAQNRSQAVFDRMAIPWSRSPRNANFTDLWSFLPPRIATKGRPHMHPCEKPLGPCQRLVEMLAHQDSTVLDPFLGSGTTAIACIRTGRQCIGIEKEQRYFDIACKRIDNELRNHQLNLPLQEAPVTQ